MALLEEGVDILVLGEIAPDDIKWLEGFINRPDYRFDDVTNSGKRSKFNMAVVARRQKVGEASREFLMFRDEENYKVAARIIVELPGSKPLAIFAVHWPSQQWLSSRDYQRVFLGRKLAKGVLALSELQLSGIIALGDFNEEPFEPAVSRNLKSTRDAQLVKIGRRPNDPLLYNPFWKEMLKGPHDEPARDSGTHYYPRDKIHPWRVFDQMMFSAELLGPGDWSLDAASTGVWRRSELMDAVRDRKSKLDHFPVIATIRRRNEQ